ncbi:MAG: tryptophan synthase subunit alpha [Proteobacteria bacterium]|jgi:tryptophan synthase alpha chain|nr:tryptophan synthase subunit alpha [Pseudomonadota bacterium]MDA1299285.1 tryptophan synthase subunit alpha [Pseudomonadota bacterium]
MGRLGSTFGALATDGRKALLAYVVAGDPEPETTVNLMHEMVSAGVDAIELGVPFSDPEAEGPVIQAAHERALAHHIRLRDCLDMVSRFRETDNETPVILMGYLNPIESMGYEAFAARSAQAGVDGMIIVNLPPEEAGVLMKSVHAHDLDLVYLLAPTTTDERAAMICKASRGFVYYVSLKGTTGAATIDVNDVASKLDRFRRFSSLPLLVGFGIKNGETAARVAGVSDGVVVGSAIVDLMARNRDDPVGLNRSVVGLVTEIRQAMDAGR